MKTFNVEVPFKGVIYFSVKAGSGKEALEKVNKRFVVEAPGLGDVVEAGWDVLESGLARKPRLDRGVKEGVEA